MIYLFEIQDSDGNDNAIYDALVSADTREAASERSPRALPQSDRSYGVEAKTMLHLYSRSKGYALIMACGATSRAPGKRVPYVGTLRAFRGFPKTEQCASCAKAAEARP